ncbi:hypothetical protein [Roseiarcus sp.]|jgi:hypothetical protein|uniref:hypothetical protein n=1 Tax=Roseiarcus sp. TaxID=1969460 RepID=UPI003D0D516A
MTTLITPKFLVDYTTPPVFNDYRCVVNAAGAQVIFERADYNSTTKKSGSVRLYLLTLGGDPAAPLFQKAIADGTNRTDWFWGNAGTVTFDYVPKTGSKAICVARPKAMGMVQSFSALLPATGPIRPGFRTACASQS